MDTTISLRGYAKKSAFAPAFPAQMHRAPFLARTLTPDAAPELLPSLSRGLLDSSTLGPRSAEAASIYLVDDTEGLTELYTIFLEGTGSHVRAFNDRAEALTALTADNQGPDLLILDCLGDDMPVDTFMQRCLWVHPTLRFLMASGLSQSDVRCSSVRPNRFIQKPFTADEFLKEVRAVLAGKPPW